VAAGFHSQNGNGEMTGVSWIEESGTFAGPIAITNTHAVGVAHAGIVAWVIEHHPALADAWLLMTGREGHRTPALPRERVRAALARVLTS
jgi:L-aminopeptidase/D-esterase-like protein